MDDVLATISISENRSLYISTLARNTFSDSFCSFGGDGGFFIYEVDETPGSTGIEILAKVGSYEAALRLVEITKATLFVKPSAPLYAPAAD